MCRKQILSAGALVALYVLAAFSLQARAAGQEGMVVVRDQQTGKLRAPTPEEARALNARTPRAASLAPRALATRPDGARGVRLGEKSMVYEVITRAADGKLSSQCVHGEDAAHDALAHPAPANHQEHDHETR